MLEVFATAEKVEKFNFLMLCTCHRPLWSTLCKNFKYKSDIYSLDGLISGGFLACLNIESNENLACGWFYIKIASFCLLCLLFDCTSFGYL